MTCYTLNAIIFLLYMLCYPVTWQLKAAWSNKLASLLNQTIKAMIFFPPLLRSPYFVLPHPQELPDISGRSQAVGSETRLLQYCLPAFKALKCFDFSAANDTHELDVAVWRVWPILFVCCCLGQSNRSTPSIIHTGSKAETLKCRHHFMWTRLN